MGGVLGANVMRDHNVVFDYENRRVGFAEGSCDYRADKLDTIAEVDGDQVRTYPARLCQSSVVAYRRIFVKQCVQVRKTCRRMRTRPLSHTKATRQAVKCVFCVAVRPARITAASSSKTVAQS